MIDSSKKEPRIHSLLISANPQPIVKDLISCHLKTPKNTIRLSADSLIVSAGFLIASADTIRIFTRGIDLWDRTRCLLINTTYLMIQEIVSLLFSLFCTLVFHVWHAFSIKALSQTNT